MSIVQDFEESVTSSECATTNTIHVYTWEELNDQVQHSKKSTDFHAASVEYDPALSDGQNYFRILFSLLIRDAMRLMGQGMTDHRQLRFELWLESYPKREREALTKVGHGDAPGCRYSDEAMFQCERALAAALKNFDAETYRRKQEQGRAGGRAYSTYTHSDFFETQGMGAAEAAKHLGIKVRNVYNMRRRYAINEQTGEVYER